MIAVTKGVARARNPFFVVMAAAVALTVFLGFAPSFYLRSTFNPDKDLSIRLHIHGFALSAWIVLFLVQTILIVRGSPTLHRRLGWVMSGLAASIVVLMGAAIVDQMQRTPPPFPAAFALAFGMFDIIVFATLVGWAIYWRKRPRQHRRAGADPGGLDNSAHCFVLGTVDKFRERNPATGSLAGTIATLDNISVNANN